MDETKKVIDEKTAALCKKMFSGTMYEHVGDPVLFKKLYDAGWAASQARSLAECERTGGMYDRYESNR